MNTALEEKINDLVELLVFFDLCKNATMLWVSQNSKVAIDEEERGFRDFFRNKFVRKLARKDFEQVREKWLFDLYLYLKKIFEQF